MATFQACLESKRWLSPSGGNMDANRANKEEPGSLNPSRILEPGKKPGITETQRKMITLKKNSAGDEI